MASRQSLPYLSLSVSNTYTYIIIVSDSYSYSYYTLICTNAIRLTWHWRMEKADKSTPNKYPLLSSSFLPPSIVIFFFFLIEKEGKKKGSFRRNERKMLAHCRRGNEIFYRKNDRRKEGRRARSFFPCVQCASCNQARLHEQPRLEQIVTTTKRRSKHPYDDLPSSDLGLVQNFA